MKKILALILILFSLQTSAQEFMRAMGSKEFKNLSAGKVYLVQCGNKSIDDKMQESMKEFWKVTPYEVISSSKFLPLFHDEQNYFIVPRISDVTDYTFPIPEGNKVVQGNFEIAFLAGGEKKMETGIYICQVDYESYFLGNDGYFFQIPLMVNDLSRSVDLVIKNNIKNQEDKGAIEVEVAKIESKDAPAIKSKTLLVNEDYFNGKLLVKKKPFLNEADLKQLGVNYKIVSAKEIIEKIESRDPAYCYLSIRYFIWQNMDATFCRMIVYDMASLNQYYHNTLPPLPVNAGSIKKLADAINGMSK